MGEYMQGRNPTLHLQPHILYPPVTEGNRTLPHLPGAGRGTVAAAGRGAAAADIPAVTPTVIIAWRERLAVLHGDGTAHQLLAMRVLQSANGILDVIELHGDSRGHNKLELEGQQQ